MLIACPSCNAVNRVPEPRLADAPTCGRCKSPLFSARPLVLTAANFDAQLTRGELPLIVDFWAPWCGPCLSMAPSFERAAAEIEPQARLAKLDTEAEAALAARFNIRSIPTLIAFRSGREIARQSGALPLPALLQWMRRAIA
ncbi:MAG: thioredoxin TrxC [Gammaproteobacteria bacterium]|nr:thioredoxin TrxC [Gammaproteobacteria bacterium]